MFLRMSSSPILFSDVAGGSDGGGDMVTLTSKLDRSYNLAGSFSTACYGRSLCISSSVAALRPTLDAFCMVVVHRA
jgi:hypothetical protein